MDGGPRRAIDWPLAQRGKKENEEEEEEEEKKTTKKKQQKRKKEKKKRFWSPFQFSLTYIHT